MTTTQIARIAEAAHQRLIAANDALAERGSFTPTVLDTLYVIVSNLDNDRTVNYVSHLAPRTELRMLAFDAATPDTFSDLAAGILVKEWNVQLVRDGAHEDVEAITLREWFNRRVAGLTSLMETIETMNKGSAL